MKRSSLRSNLLAAAALVSLAGCTTPQRARVTDPVQPRVAQTETAVVVPSPDTRGTASPAAERRQLPAGENRPAAPDPATAAPPRAQPAPAAPGPTPGEAWMTVQTEPEGAMIVIDGRPLGRAPQQIAVPVTGRGYLARTLSVKVRFVANGSGTTSNTTEIVLTPLDRAPVRLDVTPQGSKRTLSGLN